MSQDELLRLAHVETLCIGKAKDLIGPEAPYSKIGRERRAKLRAEIAKAMIEMYQIGIKDERARHHA